MEYTYPYTEFAPPRFNRDSVLSNLVDGRKGYKSGVDDRLDEVENYYPLEIFRKIFPGVEVPDYYDIATFSDLLTCIPDTGDSGRSVEISYNHSFILIRYTGGTKFVKIFPDSDRTPRTSAGYISFICPVSLIDRSLIRELENNVV